jgi:putative transposase
MINHIPHRKNIRLPYWDYSQAGYYFVTICTQHKHPYFVNEDISRMITTTWYALNKKYPCIVLDQFIVMPNHIHGIIIVGADPCVRPQSEGATHGSPPTLGEMIRWFKTMTTNYYIRGIHQYNWPPFSGKLWQRNYYDHIIRNEKSLLEIRAYINNNPHQ